jgi:hypothetical protein
MVGESRATVVAIPVDPAFRETLRLQRGTLQPRVFVGMLGVGALVGFAAGLSFSGTNSLSSPVGLAMGVVGALVMTGFMAWASSIFTRQGQRDLAASTWLRARGIGSTHLVDTPRLRMRLLRLKGADGADVSLMATGFADIELQPLVVDYTRYGRDILIVEAVGGKVLYRRPGYVPPPVTDESSA